MIEEEMILILKKMLQQTNLGEKRSIKISKGIFGEGEKSFLAKFTRGDTHIRPFTPDIMCIPSVS